MKFIDQFTKNVIDSKMIFIMLVILDFKILNASYTLCKQYCT